MPLLLCPNDNGSMQSVTRSGVEFDICPTCRGVWLDRGELEKLMEAAVEPLPDDRPHTQPRQPGDGFARRPSSAHHDGRRDWDDDDVHHRNKRRWNIFDVFD